MVLLGNCFHQNLFQGFHVHIGVHHDNSTLPSLGKSNGHGVKANIASIMSELQRLTAEKYAETIIILWFVSI